MAIWLLAVFAAGCLWLEAAMMPFLAAEMLTMTIRVAAGAFTRCVAARFVGVGGAGAFPALGWRVIDGLFAPAGWSI